jgi:predicted dehydrogenase
MIKNLIIGAGQLGSRHLQGLLKYNNIKQTIYVIDPSLEALNSSRARASEIGHNHQLFFQQDWNNLSETFDLVIVATNADVREKVINQLLSHCKVKYLLLEKVLFTELLAYQRVNELLKSRFVNTWVNHPRRMFNSYMELKKLIGKSFYGTFQLTGGNWGLGCNGLHFIDFFEYISGSKLETIDADWADSEILESKRKGFVEFTGTLKGKLANGSYFQITSLKGEPSAGTILFFDGENRFIIQESGTPAIYYMKKSDGFKQNIIPFIMEFQSSLTTKLLEELLSTGSCDLPTYEEAKHTHELFITALLKPYNTMQKTDNYILPIT